MSGGFNTKRIEATSAGAAISIGNPVTGGTPGSVLFVGVGPTLAQDNSHLYFDDSNDRLGVGTNTPFRSLQVAEDTISSGAVTFSATIGTSTFTTSASLTLQEGTFIIPDSDPTAVRTVKVTNTGTSFTIDSTWGASFVADTFTMNSIVTARIQNGLEFNVGDGADVGFLRASSELNDTGFLLAGGRNNTTGASIDMYGIAYAANPGEMYLSSGGEGVDTGFIQLRHHDGTTYQNQMRITKEGDLGLGTTSPDYAFEMANIEPYLAITGDATANGYANFIGRRSAGTLAAPTATTSGQALFQLEGQGYNGSAFVPGARIRMHATENYTAAPNARGTDMRFFTVENGTPSMVQRMKIDNNGQIVLGIGTPTAFFDLEAPGVAATDGIQIQGADAAARIAQIYVNTNGELILANNANGSDNVTFKAAEVQVADSTLLNINSTAGARWVDDIPVRMGTNTDYSMVYSSGNDTLQFVTGGTVDTNVLVEIDDTSTDILTRLNLASVAGTVVEGDIWNDSTQQGIQSYLGATEQTLNSTIFTGTADATIANTVVETSIIGTGVGTLTLGADFFVPGKTLKFHVHGYHSSTGNPNITVKAKLGGTVVCSSMVASGNGTVNGFDIEGEITCRTTGVTGTVVAGGVYEELHSGGAETGLVKTTATTVDTTGTLAFDITIEWGTAAVGNTITSQIAVLQIKN